MKLCPQCEFIYEDDQKFCDMDGQELVHDPKPHAFAESAVPATAQLRDDRAETPVTKIHIPIPDPIASPVANAAANRPANLPSKWQPRGVAVAALAGLVLVALLFAVYYARTRQSQTPKANRFSSQSTNQSNDQSQAQPATPSADTQSTAAVASESAAPLGDPSAAGQALEQASADQSANEADSAGTSQPSALPAASEKSAPRDRQSAALIAASTENSRAPVIIRLTNGASIKADEAWEKGDGVWYRQAGMVTFLKRSRVRSIERSASPSRSQTAPQAEKSLAQNQPRVGKPEAARPKKDSKVTSFLKTTGRILKKPFKL